MSHSKIERLAPKSKNLVVLSTLALFATLAAALFAFPAVSVSAIDPTTNAVGNAQATLAAATAIERQRQDDLNHEFAVQQATRQAIAVQTEQALRVKLTEASIEADRATRNAERDNATATASILQARDTATAVAIATGTAWAEATSTRIAQATGTAQAATAQWQGIVATATRSAIQAQAIADQNERDRKAQVETLQAVVIALVAFGLVLATAYMVGRIIRRWITHLQNTQVPVADSDIPEVPEPEIATDMDSAVRLHDFLKAEAP